MSNITNRDLIEFFEKNPKALVLLFWDGVKTVDSKLKTPSEIEKQEQGYFKALASAFLNRLGSNTELTSNEIKSLHKDCQNSVNGLNKNVGMGFTAGMQQFEAKISTLEQFKSHLDHHLMIKQQLDSKGSLNEEYKEDILNLHMQLYDKNFKRTVPINELVNTKLDNSDIERFNKITYINLYDNNSLVSELVNSILEQYHSNISASQTEDDKLTAIINMAQSLERLHPFTDANCRTLCMVLLNLELIKNGLLPSLQDNPNLFESLPATDLVNKIKEGQQRFQCLFNDELTIDQLEYRLENNQLEKISSSWLNDDLLDSEIVSQMIQLITDVGNDISHNTSDSDVFYNELNNQPKLLFMDSFCNFEDIEESLNQFSN
ncbi:MAG: hypothetical protein EP298_06960 [Gammaproteobacteria bacterium]|nr:MAG: hypothetical protein EP298_06960 [Gammaproteobacteria bacterium]UTW42974.1 Fic family protein [bacterium SCSIO 12844]